MIDKIEAAKEISSTVSENVAKISAEISQCVAMGAKAYTFIKVLHEVCCFILFMTIIVSLIYFVGKYTKHILEVNKHNMEIEKEQMALKQKEYELQVSRYNKF